MVEVGLLIASWEPLADGDEDLNLKLSLLMKLDDLFLDSDLDFVFGLLFADVLGEVLADEDDLFILLMLLLFNEVLLLLFGVDVRRDLFKSPLTRLFLRLDSLLL